MRVLLRRKKFALLFTERPDPPAGLEVIEIGSRSIRLLWKRSFDGNSPIRNYVIQYRSLGHGMADDWNPVKTHNVTYTPGSSNSGNSIHPTQNGSSTHSSGSISRFSICPPSATYINSRLIAVRDHGRRPRGSSGRWSSSGCYLYLQDIRHKLYRRERTDGARGGEDARGR